jgi:hypothetical protein
MTSICIVLLIYKRDQIHIGNLLNVKIINKKILKHFLFQQGFQAHGTKSSDEYRKLIALIRETQTTHLFPHSIDSKVISSKNKSVGSYLLDLSLTDISTNTLFVFQSTYQSLFEKILFINMSNM